MCQRMPRWKSLPRSLQVSSRRWLAFALFVALLFSSLLLKQIAFSLVQPTAQSGYHSDPTVLTDDTVKELRNLEMIRARCGKVFERAQAGKGKHFALDMTKMRSVFDLVMKTTKANYPDLNIPYHSRWRHFNDLDVAKLTAGWKCDETEKVRRLLDLVTVSVLLDAGAGNAWHYIDIVGIQKQQQQQHICASDACLTLNCAVLCA